MYIQTSLTLGAFAGRYPSDSSRRGVSALAGFVSGFFPTTGEVDIANVVGFSDATATRSRILAGVCVRESFVVGEDSFYTYWADVIVGGVTVDSVQLTSLNFGADSVFNVEFWSEGEGDVGDFSGVYRARVTHNDAVLFNDYIPHQARISPQIPQNPSICSISYETPLTPTQSGYSYADVRTTLPFYRDMYRSFSSEADLGDIPPGYPSYNTVISHPLAERIFSARNGGSTDFAGNTGVFERINRCVFSLVDAGLTSCLRRLWVTTASTETAACVDWLAPWDGTRSLTPMSTSFNALAGIRGSSVGGYYDTNVPLSDLPSEFEIGILTTAVITGASNGNFFGALDSSGVGVSCSATGTTGVVTYRAMTSTDNNTPSGVLSPGLLALSIQDGGDFAGLVSGDYLASHQTTGITPGSATTNNLFVGAINDDGTAVTGLTPYMQAVYIGAPLAEEQRYRLCSIIGEYVFSANVLGG